MKSTIDSGFCPEARALAAQKIITAFFSRLQQLDPELRIFAAQVLEDAAAALEMDARGENDPGQRRLLRATLETVEFVRDSTLGTSSHAQSNAH